MSTRRLFMSPLALEHASTTQEPGVVSDGVDAQHVLAFGVCLQR